MRQARPRCALDRQKRQDGSPCGLPPSAATRPQNHLEGLAVSAGVYEGRARIVHEPSEPPLRKGDILVTVCGKGEGAEGEGG